MTPDDERELSEWRAKFSRPELAERRIEQLRHEVDRAKGIMRGLLEPDPETDAAEILRLHGKVEQLRAELDKKDVDRWLTLHIEWGRAVRLAAERLGIIEAQESRHRVERAAANALLDSVPRYAPQVLEGSSRFGGMARVDGGAWLKADDVRDHLSGQPTAPTTVQRLNDSELAAECVRRGLRCVRPETPGGTGYGDAPDPDVKTAAEQRVLNAARGTPDEALHTPITHAEKLYPLCDEIQRYKAELARREAGQ